MLSFSRNFFGRNLFLGIRRNRNHYLIGYLFQSNNFLFKVWKLTPLTLSCYYSIQPFCQRREEKGRGRNSFKHSLNEEFMKFFWKLMPLSDNIRSSLINPSYLTTEHFIKQLNQEKFLWLFIRWKSFCSFSFFFFLSFLPLVLH